MAGSAGFAQFRVRIYGLGGSGLQLPSGESAIKLRVNFDGFKEFETEERSLDANPTWTEDVAFTYSTKHSNQLSRKKLRVKLLTVSSGFFGGSTKEWGEAAIDLHTLATGPVTHRNIRVLDGSSPRGGINVQVEMEQIITATVNFEGMRVTSNPTADAGSAALQYSYNGHHQYTSNAVCSRAGGPTFTHLPQLRLDTVFHTFTTSGIAFWLRSHSDGKLGATVASGTFPTANTPIFTHGKPANVDVGLTGADGRPAGRLIGRLFYTGCPSFLQMRGGYHTDTGIYGASAVVPGLENKPKVYVQPAAGASGAPSTRLGRLGSAVLAGPTLRGAGHRGHQAAAHARTPAFPTAAPGLTSGQLGAQIAVRALGGGRGRGRSAAPGTTVVLPWFYDRRTDSRNGRVYFYNTLTGASMWDLPTAESLQVTFPAPGPLGLELEHNFSGTQRFGKPSGRRNSGSDSGAVIKTVVPGGAAVRLCPTLAPGMHLSRVNGVSTQPWTLGQTLRILRHSARPLTLVFLDPYAVPSAVATAAADPSTPVTTGPKARVVVPPGRGGGSAAPAAPAPAPAPASDLVYTYGTGAGSVPDTAPASGGGVGGAARGSGGVSAGSSSPSEGLGLDEAAGWVQMKDHMSGKVFWLNNATGAVSFSKPGGA